MYYDLAHIQSIGSQYLFARGQVIFALINSVLIYRERKKLKSLIGSMNDVEQIEEVKSELEGNHYKYAVGLMWLLSVLSLLDIISVLGII